MIKRTEITTLRAVYAGLKPEGRTLVHALALMGMPMRPAALLRWLSESGLKMDHGAQFCLMASRPLLVNLLKSRILVVKEDWLEVAPAFLEEGRTAALKEKRLRPAIDTLGSFIPDTHFSLAPDAPGFLQEKHLGRLRSLLRLAVAAQSVSLLELCGRELISLRQDRRITLSPDPVREAIAAAGWEGKKKVNAAFQSTLLSYMTAVCLTDLSPLPESLMAGVVQEGDDSSLARQALLFFYLGAEGARQKLLPRLGEEEQTCHRAVDALFSGQYEDAARIFDRALLQKRKNSVNRTVLLEPPFQLLMILAIFADRSPKNRSGFDRIVKLMEGSSGIPGCREQVLSLMQSMWDGRPERLPFEFPRDFEELPVGQQWLLLILIWVTDSEAFLSVLPACIKVAETALAGGYRRIAAELYQAIALKDGRGSIDASVQAAALTATLGIGSSLTGRFAPQAPWEHALRALESMGKAEGSGGGAEGGSEAGSTRLIWHLTVEERQGSLAYAPFLLLEPVEQTRRKSGGWSKGRKVSLGRLCEDREEMDFITDHDFAICSAIQMEHYNRHGYRQTEYSFALDQALVALAGHPNVFWASAPKIRVEVVTGRVEVRLLREEEGYLMQLFPVVQDNEYGVAVLRESPTRVRVIPLDTAYRQLSPILGAGGILIPPQGESRLKAVITQVAGVIPVHSDLEIGTGSIEVVTVEANVSPLLHLMPHGEGLRVDLLVRPLGGEGPCTVPGSGGETLIADLQGERRQTRRNLAAERSEAQVVIQACPLLALEGHGLMHWIFEHPEDCLELILSLQALGDSVKVEWPRGGEFHVSSPLDWRHTRVAIKKHRDWFTVDGKVEVAEGQVMELRSLLELMRQAKGRFIPMGQGQFITLTEEFKRRLDELSGLGELGEDGLALHPLSAFGLEDLLKEAESLEADQHWQEFQDRLREVGEYTPAIPSTLQAELRDYQMEGFIWLCRLARWGAGACLADDMGLGKTMQALALLLERSTVGPALVVAPTSVCFNWVEEAARFAPTLNLTLFGPGDRKACVESLGPRDVLVCSYSLLQQEEEILTGVEWATAVLDEAQAIKNMDTKRSRAAMKLKAGFRLITTGTPLENHLGELWNLFHFINPGLLGNSRFFSDEFALPIERHQDKRARATLRRRIQPFILRRTKSQVLDELPPRTEVLRHIELDERERAFYEALRQNAVEEVESLEEGNQGMQVLAQIMRLRRACCNPSLIEEGLDIPCAKLEAFSGIIEELVENRHKALVFSQFVGHLAILRRRLDEMGVSYQYLDGSTPSKERAVRVTAFQSGEGDVFLISLKAGGTGLNLTAADYVIHMDPWWNPAVEDQASDRAHRIGQTRPVTVYRLVARDTIEDRIVALHHEKRDLADSLLEGTEMSARLTTADLLNLLKEG